MSGRALPWFVLVFFPHSSPPPPPPGTPPPHGGCQCTACLFLGLPTHRLAITILGSALSVFCRLVSDGVSPSLSSVVCFDDFQESHTTNISNWNLSQYVELCIHPVPVYPVHCSWIMLTTSFSYPGNIFKLDINLKNSFKSDSFSGFATQLAWS